MLRLLEEHGVDRIIFVGDLADRGPDSLACIRIARTWKFEDRDGKPQSIECVIGNHEINYLYSIHDWELPFRGFVPEPKTTERQFIWNHLSAGDLEWLESLPYAIRVDELGVMVVHGGIAPWMNNCPTDYDRDLGYRLTKIVRVKKLDVLMGADTKDEGKFWAELYDGRFGTVYFGHTTHDTVRHYKHAVGVDMSKGGVLAAVVISDEDGDKKHANFFVRHRDKESIRDYRDPTAPAPKKEKRTDYQPKQRKLFQTEPTRPRFEPDYNWSSPPSPSDMREKIERTFSDAPPKKKRHDNNGKED